MSLKIAMDGPVGSGKSSIADAVAARLHILHLDTGAMYRTMGLAALRSGTPLDDEAAVTALCGEVAISVNCMSAGQQTLLNGEDVSGLIRTEEVGMAASAVSRYAGVRKAMVALQQKLAEETSMLVDGRDICLRVLPDADVKIFMTASAEARAERRMKQLLAKGAAANYDEILADLIRRDEQDSSRAVDPLKPTPDAVIVDTTHMDFNESVEAILALIEKKTGVKPEA